MVAVAVAVAAALPLLAAEAGPTAVLRRFVGWAEQEGVSPDGAEVRCGDVTGCWGLHASRDLPARHVAVRVPRSLTLTDLDVIAGHPAGGLRHGDAGSCAWPHSLLQGIADGAGLDDSAFADLRVVLRLHCIRANLSADSATFARYLSIAGSPPPVPWLEDGDAACLSPDQAQRRRESVEQLRRLQSAARHHSLWPIPIRPPELSEAATTVGMYATRAFRVPYGCVGPPRQGTAAVLAPVVDMANMDTVSPNVDIGCDGTDFLLRVKQGVPAGAELFADYLGGGAHLPSEVWDRYGYVPGPLPFLPLRPLHRRCSGEDSDLWVSADPGSPAASEQLVECLAAGGSEEDALREALRMLDPGSPEMQRHALRGGRCSESILGNARAAAAATRETAEVVARRIRERMSALRTGEL